MDWNYRCTTSISKFIFVCESLTQLFRILDPQLILGHNIR